jgi:ubiquinone/menaquinone biosynthesis C-methylase UbiE
MRQSISVQELYTKRTSFYDRLFIDFLGWGKELKASFQKSDYLHPNSKIMDAGCGTGIITRVLY